MLFLGCWKREERNSQNALISNLLNSGLPVINTFVLFSVPRRKRRNSCDCPTDSIMSQVLSIEYNENLEARVLWYDEKHKKIWSTDVSGCPCVTLITSVKNEPNGNQNIYDLFYYNFSVLKIVREAFLPHKCQSQKSNTSSNVNYSTLIDYCKSQPSYFCH